MKIFVPEHDATAYNIGKCKQTIGKFFTCWKFGEVLRPLSSSKIGILMVFSPGTNFRKGPPNKVSQGGIIFRLRHQTQSCDLTESERRS